MISIVDAYYDEITPPWTPAQYLNVDPVSFNIVFRMLKIEASSVR